MAQSVNQAQFKMVREDKTIIAHAAQMKATRDNQTEIARNTRMVRRA